MGEPIKKYLVDASVLPEVFLKVVEAKRLLQTGAVKTVDAAVRAVNLSRSAFYKYRDTVHPFVDMTYDRILTLTCLLRDEPGVLSAVLGVFAQAGANVLTIHQTIPANGLAHISVSIQTGGMAVGPDELDERLRATPGVVSTSLIASEQEQQRERERKNPS